MPIFWPLSAAKAASKKTQSRIPLQESGFALHIKKRHGNIEIGKSQIIVPVTIQSHINARCVEIWCHGATRRNDRSEQEPVIVRTTVFVPRLPYQRTMF